MRPWDLFVRKRPLCDPLTPARSKNDESPDFLSRGRTKCGPWGLSDIHTSKVTTTRCPQRCNTCPSEPPGAAKGFPGQPFDRYFQHLLEACAPKSPVTRNPSRNHYLYSPPQAPGHAQTARSRSAGPPENATFPKRLPNSCLHTGQPRLTLGDARLLKPAPGQPVLLWLGTGPLINPGETQPGSMVVSYNSCYN